MTVYFSGLSQVYQTRGIAGKIKGWIVKKRRGWVAPIASVTFLLF